LKCGGITNIWGVIPAGTGGQVQLLIIGVVIMDNGNKKSIMSIVYTVLTLIIIALLTVFINQGISNTAKVQIIEVKQAVTENTVKTMSDDIKEIKSDIKTLLSRDK